MSDQSERIVPVIINGQRYPVRSSLPPSYVGELAAYVDEKMRLAGEANRTNDSVQLAVLTALNLADEIFRYRKDREARAGEIADRTSELERLLDAVLEGQPRLR